MHKLIYHMKWVLYALLSDYTPAQIGPAKQRSSDILSPILTPDARQANPSPKQRSADTT